MPFTSPFGSVMTPSFNPAYSNVPQNKPPKPVEIPQNKPPKAESVPETPTSSVEELNAGIMPHIFASQPMQVPTAPQFNAMPMTSPTPPTPVAMPQQFPMTAQYIPSKQPGMPGLLVIPIFQPQYSTSQQGLAVQPTEEPRLQQRLNPQRPIFV